MSAALQQRERPIYDVPIWRPDESSPWEPLSLQEWDTAEQEFYQEQYGTDQMWLNHLYMVTVRERGSHVPYGRVVSLTILQHNGDIRRDWREWQQIKNQIVGPEWTAIEVYPPESQMVDNGNTFHLWCFDSRLPFGLNHGKRQIIFDSNPSSRPNRQFAPGEEPEDTFRPGPGSVMRYVGK